MNEDFINMSSVISICASTSKIDSFYKYSLAMLQSMKENSGLDLPIIFHYDNMTEKQRDNLKKVNLNIQEFKKIPIEKYRRFNKCSGGWYVLEGWALKDYDRVIILDSDFICQGNISYLNEVECDLGMCQQANSVWNAGLVVASKKLLQEDWYWKMISCKQDDVHMGGDRDKFSKDQKLINVWLGNRVTKIDRKYNWLIDKLAHKALMIHYIYKPLYEVGLKQLNERNPDLVKIWYKYYNRAMEVINE
jgi:lipopolysaccharide biosynthesis glycosyltransferase